MCGKKGIQDKTTSTQKIIMGQRNLLINFPNRYDNVFFDIFLAGVSKLIKINDSLNILV